jgi:CubicO group peptidase (beta-lactamase class C family)
MVKKSLFSLALLLVAFTGQSQLDTVGFSDFIRSVHRDFNLPSMSVAIVKDGKTILTEHVGITSNTESKAPDENTLYAIASLSKAFTAASMAMLVEEGKVNWKDPVKKHLPWFQLDDEYVSEHMTVEDLLCHRSGFKTFDGDLLWYGTNYSTKEAIERLRERPLEYDFRTQFGYQNLMFMTAGEVIAAASGMTWSEFVQTRILDPLKMNRTTSNFEEFSIDKNIAKPFIHGSEVFMLSYNNSAATAALNSCTSDMARWLNFWLNDGIVGGDTLLSKSSINKIWSLHTPLGTGSFDKSNGTHFKGYGLGWFLMDYKGQKVAHHGGGLPGYITKVALVDEAEFGVVVLTNDMSSAPAMMMYAAIDWLNGEDYKSWSKTFLEFKEKGEARKEKAKSERLKTKEDTPLTLPISDYLGEYEDEMYGKAEVLLDGADMVLVLKPAKELFSGKLTPWSKHAFRFDHNDPFLTYGVVKFKVVLDKVKGFEVDLPNDDFHFDKLYFERK